MPLRCWPHVETARCTGCGWCVAVCPPHVLSLHRQGWHKHAVLHHAVACTGCRLCERRCPFGAIAMVTAPPMAQHAAADGSADGSADGASAAP